MLMLLVIVGLMLLFRKRKMLRLLMRLGARLLRLRHQAVVEVAGAEEVVEVAGGLLLLDLK